MKGIPDKLYFKIGEVSEITGVKTYVLRYWETEFPFIAPLKTKTKHRLYRKKDIEIVNLIKKMLYDEKLTIQGARKKLNEMLSGKGSSETDRGLDLVKIRDELIELREFLSS